MFNYKKYTEIKEIIQKKSRKTEIIAISKNHDLAQVQKATSSNVKIFGENRVQEATQKFKTLKKQDDSIKLHLTGPLQTNKVRDALEIFDCFHTLDREKLLKEISKHPEKTKNKSFFVQVNTGKEESKSGIFPENVESFLKLCTSYGINNIEGLMCIPPINETPKKHFLLLDEICKHHGLKGLSIGMSSDYLDALEFNPLYIRLGTILFGKRK